ELVVVTLAQPFEPRLKEKQEGMDATIDALTRLVEYEIADVTAAATYYMAETYFDFSRSLKESERPADLQPADLEKYESDLDETAFPFEEKAIKVHEKNIELLHGGVFNEWTKKSLSRLTELMPGRYAKSELSSGFLGAMDSYVYRAPVSQVTVPPSADAPTTSGKPEQTTQQPVPIAVNEGAVVKNASPQ